MNKQHPCCCSFRMKQLRLERCLSNFERVLRLVLLVLQIWTLFQGF